MLTEKIIKNSLPRKSAYKIADYSGLYLFISPTGLKSWRYNLLELGKQKTVIYGRHPDLSIQEARANHVLFRQNKKNKSAIKFGVVAENWMRNKLPRLKNYKSSYKLNHYVNFLCNYLKNHAISEISRAEAVTVVKRLDDRPDTARAAAGYLRAIFDYAIDCGYIEHNPVINLSRVLPVCKHTPYASIAPGEVGELMRAVNNYPDRTTQLGIWLLAYTFVRTRELTESVFEEFRDDFWLIPAIRTKANKAHLVPLSKQVRDILDELKIINQTENNKWVMQSPKRRGHHICENTLLFALYRLGYKGRMTGHGFRSLASTVLNESGLWNPDAIERQLGHNEKDAVRAAYHRAEYIDERKKMMQWWSDWLDNSIK